MTIEAGSINVVTADVVDNRALRPAAQAAQRRFGEELRAFAAANGGPLAVDGWAFRLPARGVAAALSRWAGGTHPPN